MLDPNPNNHDNDFDHYMPHHYDYDRWSHMNFPHHNRRHHHREDDHYWYNYMRNPYDYDNYYYDTDYMMYPFFQVPEYSENDIIPTLAPAAGDPPPKLSNNPQTTSMALTKELTGYPNYGNPSGNADILYKGNRGTWTFTVPTPSFTPGNLRGTLLISAVLDDHSNVPIRRYSAKITVNGFVVHDGPLPLEHGAPSGMKFNNWSTLKFNIPVIRRTTRITIENTSKTDDNDFIALE